MRWTRGLALATMAIVGCDSERPTVCPDGGCAIDSRAIDTVEIDSPESPSCTARIGDLTQPIELVAVRPGMTVSAEDIVDGGEVELTVPPQGGIVMLVGVRARNVDGCAAQLTAALRDPTTQQVVGLETRPTYLLAGADGFGVPTEPLFNSLANLAVCPAQAATRDIYDQPWQLELAIDSAGHHAQTTLTVIPRCPPPGGFTDCPCVCDADYVPGVCREGFGDGGLPDVTDAAGADAGP